MILLIQLDSIKYVQELLQKDQTLSQFLQTYLLRVLIKINNSIACHDVEEKNVKMIASLVLIIEYIGPDVYLMSSQVFLFLCSAHCDSSECNQHYLSPRQGFGSMDCLAKDYGY